MEDDVERLDVQNGDILVLRGDGDAETMSHLGETLRRVLYARNIDDVMILVMNPTTSIETLSEEDMRKAGWVRA